MAVIGGACFVASMMVLGLVNEREGRHDEARREIAASWGERQTIAGPMLVAVTPGKEGESDVRTYILPENLSYEATIEPEERTRGIFTSVVYNSKVTVSGEFSTAEIRDAIGQRKELTFSVPVTDTRGIERQIELTWNGEAVAFRPGSGIPFEGSGFHAFTPIDLSAPSIPFDFTFDLKGSDGISIAPLGKETTLKISSPWPTPKFVGTFLPAERNVTQSGFDAEWRISSFGRSYPQTWEGDVVTSRQIIASASGVDLYEQIDLYDLVFRSIKYSVLFIVITFAAFFLFDVLMGVRIHAIQYLLIGSSLALFYLLLLSLSEQIGFFSAYVLATGLTVSLIGAYSIVVLKGGKRVMAILSLLAVLYGYLYFVLQLEDYALLFGSLLLFVFLAAIMYATRNIDWFALDTSER